MKKILSINGTSFSSTGNIVKNIERGLKDTYIFYRATADEKGKNLYLISGTYLSRQGGKFPAQTFGSDGFQYYHQTRMMVKWIDKIKPDLVHIHNVHGYFMNVELVLRYLHEHNIPVIYTMHDCWTFTGRCACFDSVNCDKWKTGCGHCKYKYLYPRTRILDGSKKQWLLKKELLTNHHITFVTPSNWLKEYTKESFLKNERILTINNGIDTDSFKPLDISKFNFPKEIDLSKKIILSVAWPFTVEKGLDDINKLQGIIDTNKYQIVLVGITKEYKTVDGIVRIPPTRSKEELAYYYNLASVFVFFTKQDNYPTVLLESLACGTPLVSYDVGGCKEIVEDNKTGFLVPKGNVEEAYEKIKEIDKIDLDYCKKVGSEHSIKSFVDKYALLYKEILEEK